MKEMYHVITVRYLMVALYEADQMYSFKWNRKQYCHVSDGMYDQPTAP